MNYNQLIGIVNETNRPPGGKNTVFEIINRLHLSEQNKVLEIGTSTGFTAIEISRFVKCKIVSIDINEYSLAEARKRAKTEGLTNIEFLKADVKSLPFKPETFDVIIIGNVFSLIEEKEKALKECIRVSKKGGFIIAIPMYYLKTPSTKIIREVSNAIGIKISPKYKKDWLEFFSIPKLEIYWTKDLAFNYIDDDKVKSFVQTILDRLHLKSLHKQAFVELKRRYQEFIFLFRDNLSLMGFTIIFLSKRKIWEDPELFTAKPSNENNK